MDSRWTDRYGSQNSYLDVCSHFIAEIQFCTRNHKKKDMLFCWQSGRMAEYGLMKAKGPFSVEWVCNFFCLAYIMSRESFLHFALIDYDVKFQLQRHRMTPLQS